MNTTELDRLEKLARAVPESLIGVRKGHVGNKLADFLAHPKYDGIRIHWGDKYGASTPESEAWCRFFGSFNPATALRLIAAARSATPATGGEVADLIDSLYDAESEGEKTNGGEGNKYLVDDEAAIERNAALRQFADKLKAALRPATAAPVAEGDGGAAALMDLADYFHESGNHAAYSNIRAAAHNAGFCIDSGGADDIVPTTGECPLCGYWSPKAPTPPTV